MAEQRRIVAKVELLLTWCDDLESQIREKKEDQAARNCQSIRNRRY